MTANGSPRARLVTRKQLATYLGLSPLTIRNHGGEIPGKRSFGRGRGCAVRFDLNVIDRWLDRAGDGDDLWLLARQRLEPAAEST